MKAQIATVIYVIGVGVLFCLNRDRKVKTSPALWIPVIWLWITGSRPVSVWLGMAGPADSPDWYLEGSPLDRMVWIALLAAGFFVLANRAQKVGPLVKKNVPLILFFAYCAASIFWSNYHFVALKRWTKALGDPVMVMIILSDMNPLAAFRRFLTRTGFILFPLSVVLIKYYPKLGRMFSAGWSQMYIGATMHKNELGMICLVLGLGFLWMLLEFDQKRKQAGDWKRQFVALGMTSLSVIWLFRMSKSMTSMVCFVLGAIVIVAMGVPKLVQKRMFIHFLVGGIVFLAGAAVILHPSGGVLETLGRNSTLTGRTEVWRQVIDLAGNPVVGTGYESYWMGDRLQEMWDNNTGDRLNEAHNGYLEVYLNLGWIGVGMLGLLLLAGYRNAIAALRRDPKTGRLWVAYVVVAVIYSLTEAGFRMLAPVWFFFILATTVMPAAPLPQEVANRAPARKFPSPWEHKYQEVR